MGGMIQVSLFKQKDNTVLGELKRPIPNTSAGAIECYAAV
jgi:hypothetical protein